MSSDPGTTPVRPRRPHAVRPAVTTVDIRERRRGRRWRSDSGRIDFIDMSKVQNHAPVHFWMPFSPPVSRGKSSRRSMCFSECGRLGPEPLDVLPFSSCSLPLLQVAPEHSECMSTFFLFMSSEMSSDLGAEPQLFRRIFALSHLIFTFDLGQPACVQVKKHFPEARQIPPELTWSIPTFAKMSKTRRSTQRDRHGPTCENNIRTNCAASGASWPWLSDAVVSRRLIST